MLTKLFFPTVAGVRVDRVWWEGQALQVAEVILGNRLRPANEVSEARGGLDAECPAQLGGCGADQAVVVPVEHLAAMPAAAQGTQQHHARRRTSGEDR